MNEWGVFITLGAIVGSFFTFYKFVKGIEDTIADKSQESLEATQENTKQLILFNANLQHMQELDRNRDRLTESHSVILKDHEIRLVKIENTQYIKDRSGQ